MFWLKLAIALNVVGVGMAVVAALPGAIDWAFGIRSGTGAKRDGAKHGLLNVSSLGFFAEALAIYAGHWNGPATSATAGVVLAAFGWLCTLAAGWYGWMLVQGWHVGVDMHESQVRSERCCRRRERAGRAEQTRRKDHAGAVLSAALARRSSGRSRERRVEL